MSESNNNQREEGKYYVYGHYTQDTGVLFYIGVGTVLSKSNKEKSKYSRAYHSKNRNKFWNSVVNKHGVKIKILSYWDSKEDSLKEEAKLVEQYGRRCMNQGILVNISSGGEVGPIGRTFTMSEEQKKRLSEIKSTELHIYNSQGIYLISVKAIETAARYCGVTYNAIHSCLQTKNYSSGYFIFKDFQGEKLTYTIEDLNFKSTLSKKLVTYSLSGIRLEHESVADCASYLKTDRKNLKKAIKEKRLCKGHKVKFLL
jgi:hypothetical protein